MDQETSGKGTATINPSGPVTLIVTLPRDYVKANALEKGQKMLFHYDGECITYKPLAIEDIPPVV